MATSLQTVRPGDEEPGALVVSPDQLELVRRTVAKDATHEELQLFLYDCRRRGVHPLDRMLHFTKRGGRYTPITSIDLMRACAAETGECAGIDDATFVVGEAEDGGDLVMAASVTVYRLTQGQRYPYIATARWEEYYPGEAQGHMWRKMPHTMLGKCAEALALRKAFPKQLQGLYERAEMDQAGPSEAMPISAEPLDLAPAPVKRADGSVLVTDVDSKKGGKPGQKAWTMYTVHFDDGTAATTFDGALAQQAEQAKQDGALVVPNLEQKGQYTNLLSIMPAGDTGSVQEALDGFAAEVSSEAPGVDTKMERELLNSNILALANKLELKQAERTKLWKDHCGDATPATVALEYLTDLHTTLRKRLPA